MAVERPELERILCPVDFSDFSRPALSHALHLAGFYGASLKVLHVYHLPMPPVAAGDPGLYVLSGPNRQELIDALERIVKDVGPGEVAVTCQVREGVVWREIVDELTEGAHDLLVVGTHGRGGFERLMLGSVTERVLKRAPCRTLVIPQSALARDRADRVLFRRLLCPVDFSDASIASVGTALGLAKESGGKVTLVHVVPFATPDWLPGTTGFDAEALGRDLERDARERLDGLVRPEDHEWRDPEHLVVFGAPSTEILRLAQDREVELVVMGSAGHGAIAGGWLFGSTTEHVVRACPCPVLTVPDPANPPARR